MRNLVDVLLVCGMDQSSCQELASFLLSWGFLLRKRCCRCVLALVDFEVDRFAALVAVSFTWRTDTREVWIKVGFWAHLSVMAVEKQVAVIPDCKAGC